MTALGGVARRLWRPSSFYTVQARTFLIVAATIGACGLAWFVRVPPPDGDHAVLPEPVGAKPIPAGTLKESAPEQLPSPLPDGETMAVAPSLAPALELQAGQLAWERRIEAVTQSRTLDNAAKAKHLLDLVPSLPEEAVETAAREAVMRLPDRQYAAARARLINPQTHGMVLSVLFADLLERPDEITFPALLTVARMPAHPLALEARANLELLLGKNFGADWVQWDGEIRRVLSAQR